MVAPSCFFAVEGTPQYRTWEIVKQVFAMFIVYGMLFSGFFVIGLSIIASSMGTIGRDQLLSVMMAGVAITILGAILIFIERMLITQCETTEYYQSLSSEDFPGTMGFLVKIVVGFLGALLLIIIEIYAISVYLGIDLF